MDSDEQDKKLVAGMHKEVRKVDKKFFQTKGASENTLFRKRNFLATDEDEVWMVALWNCRVVLSCQSALLLVSPLDFKLTHPASCHAPAVNTGLFNIE